MNDKLTVPHPTPITLKQVAAWDLDYIDVPRCEIRASVPALQRGLVWSPQQVELLWDSILRGFPIGSLVVCKPVGNQERSGKEGITHHLLDGQQRCNAITLGFHDPFSAPSSQVRGNKSESILWVDLAPNKVFAIPDSHDQIPKNSTRQFLTRVTTLAHPWGYTTDDNASRISARDAAGAIDWEFKGKPAPTTRPSSIELSPFRSNAPVPLSWLMAAFRKESSEEIFWSEVKRKLDEEKGKRRWPELALAILSTSSMSESLHEIYCAIHRADSTELVILMAPDEIVTGTSRREANNQGESDGNVANIEHLFNRLNRQGTPLNGEELAYSMIKAYWPGVADVIDKVKFCRFPASHLASLGVRTALTPNKDGALSREIGIPRLRTIANASLGSPDDEIRCKIEKFLGLKPKAHSPGDVMNRLASACKKVDEWMAFSPDTAPNGIPPVLISSFARKNADIYLFFLHIADRLLDEPGAVTDEQWKSVLPGLATLVHWFGRSGEGLSIADLLMESIRGGISVENIRSGLAESMKRKLIITPRLPSEIAEFIRIPSDDQQLTNWEWYPSLIGSVPEGKERTEQHETWWLFLSSIRENRELLLYSQRAYLGRRFASYDPARRDLWDEHNRPWDFDHIHAGFFFSGKQGPYAGFCRQWGSNIGNLRAWPFEDNRSDQEDSAKKKLSGNSRDMADSLIQSEAELDSFSLGHSTRSSPESARSLAEAIKARLVRVYSDWHESTGISALLADSTGSHTVDN